jgi:hypothetical protein
LISVAEPDRGQDKSHFLVGGAALEANLKSLALESSGFLLCANIQVLISCFAYRRREASRQNGVTSGVVQINSFSDSCGDSVTEQQTF